MLSNHDLPPADSTTIPRLPSSDLERMLPDGVAARLESVTYRTDLAPVLDGVSIDILRGELTSIVSMEPSTAALALQIASGLTPPQAGVVTVGHVRLHTLSSTEIARFRRAHIGYVGTAFPLATSRTVAENIRLPFDLDARQPTSSDTEWMHLLVDTLRLQDVLNLYPHELKPGVRNRVEVARAMATQPCLIAANEPTYGLEPRDRAMLLALMRAIVVEHGQAILIATGDPEVAAGGDRTIVLERGEVVADARGADAANLAARLRERAS